MRVKDLSMVSVMEDGTETVTLICDVSGTHVDEVLWYHGNLKVSASDVYIIQPITHFVTKSTLTIDLGVKSRPCPELQSLDGIYTCQAVGKLADKIQKAFSNRIRVNLKCKISLFSIFINRYISVKFMSYFAKFLTSILVYLVSKKILSLQCLF